MGNVNIPNIRDFAGAVQLGIGEAVSISIHDETQEGVGRYSHSSHDMVESVIDEVFTREGIPRDRGLETVCALIARVSVGRLAISNGFTIRYGEGSNPREIVDVVLRPAEPVARQAVVTHSSHE